jgi:hypothetical protein
LTRAKPGLLRSFANSTLGSPARARDSGHVKLADAWGDEEEAPLDESARTKGR